MPNDPNDTKNIKDKTAATDQNTESTENNTDAQKDLLKALEKLNKARKESTDELSKRLGYEAELARMTGDSIAQQKAYNQLVDEFRKKEAAYNKGEKTEQEEKALGVMKQQIEAMQKLGFTYNEITASQDKFLKEADSVFSDLATKSAIFGDPNKGMVGSMLRFSASMGKADNAMGLMGASIMKHFGPIALATGIVENIAESTIGMIKAFDEASASLAAATGTGDEFTGMMLEMRQEGNNLGVTFENSSKAIQSLIQTQVGFLNSSKAAQKEMATQVALMDRIGISTDTSAEVLNVFAVNMGKSNTEAIQMTKSLASMGSVLGNSQKFLEDFNKSMTTLAVYGDDAVGVFSNMAAAARAAGVEVGTLAGMAANFDEYDKAAETVGKLNALMGTQLSSTEMLLMKEDQRIETIIQQVQISGQSFDDMGRFQQKAIAAAAGISDMNEAQRIFGMNMKDYKKYQKDMERQAKIQENFNKALEATEPLSEKFKQFMAEFALFVQPLLDFASLILEGLTYVSSGLDTSTKYVIGALSAVLLLGVALTGMGVAAASAVAGVGGAAAGLGAITAAAVPAAPALAAVGAAAGGAAIGMGAFVLPFMGVALGVAGVVLSLGYLVSQFAELASVGPAAVGVMFAFAGAIASLSFGGGIAAIGLGGTMASIVTIIGALSLMKATIGAETSAISVALENLALIATGTSAKAMAGGGTSQLAVSLKEAVEAVMTTKIDIKLSIDDGKLYELIKSATADVVMADRTIRNEIVQLARGTT